MYLGDYDYKEHPPRELIPIYQPHSSSDTPPENTIKGRLMSHWNQLELPKNILNRIKHLAAARLPNKNSENFIKSNFFSKHETIEHPSNKKIAATNTQGLQILGGSSLKEIAMETETVEDLEKTKQRMFKKNYNDLMSDLGDFCLETAFLFEGEEELVNQLSHLINQLSTLYHVQLQNAESLTIQEFEDVEERIIEKRIAIKNCLINRVLALEKREIASSNELKTIAALVEDFQVKRLLNASISTHTLFKSLKHTMQKLKPDNLRLITDPSLRKEAYRHVKIIQEKSYKLLSIDKKLHKFSFFSFFANSGSKRTYQTIAKLAEAYENSLGFDKEEVEKFRDLTLESHRPRREHLIRFADDIFAGAFNLANQKIKEGRQAICKSYVLEKHNKEVSVVTKINEELGKQAIDLIEAKTTLQNELRRIDSIKGIDPNELVNRTKVLSKALEENEKNLEKLLVNEKGLLSLIKTYQEVTSLIDNSQDWKTFFLNLDQDSTLPSNLKDQINIFITKEKEFNAFKEAALKLSQEAQIHPDIGASKPLELLSTNLKESKKQQEKAKIAIDGLFQRLKKSYIPLLEHDLKEKIVDLEKLAAAELTKARNELLADKLRWDRPIVRNIEFKGPTKKISVEHKMSCLNAGYPSSSFRGREAGPDTIQANLQQVTITKDDGKIIANYTSSATNVEFFQKDPEKRTAATIQQTAEILSSKIDNKLASLSENQRISFDEVGNELGSKANPITVDVSATLLLSPDTLRKWLLDNEAELKTFTKKWLPQKISNTIEKHLKLDEAQLERRILQESIKAWMSFDKDNKNENMPDQFQIKDKNGVVRTLFREINDKKEPVFAWKDASGEKKYVQFAISCYNVGCNKFTKIMTNFTFGKGIETLAKGAINLLRSIKSNLPEYSGKIGQTLEDETNSKAFAKDTKRYEAKLEQFQSQKNAILGDLYIAEYSNSNPKVAAHSSEIKRLKEKLEINLNYLKNAKNSLSALKHSNLLDSDIDMLNQQIPEISKGIQDLKNKISYEELQLKKLLQTDPSIEKNTTGLKKIREIETAIGSRLREAREKLEKAEKEYQAGAKNPLKAKTLDKKRKAAFMAWKNARMDISRMIMAKLNHPNFSKEIKEYLKIVQHEENLHDLFNEIKDQFTFKDYRTKEGMDRNMYTLPSTLVIFAMELDLDPHTGCRSGKDRTSLQRMEIATRKLSKEAHGRYLNYREIEETPGLYEIREQMLLNSGHIDDLANLNIGSAGLNLSGAHGSYLKHISSDGKIYAAEHEGSTLLGVQKVFSMKLK